MSYHLLASAIGSICSQQRGLFRLLLPRSLPPSFKHKVSDALDSMGGVPVSVGDAEGEYSAGAAIAFRTPEDGSVNRAIVLIATDGQVRELKSLETYRDLLASGMPGGLGALAPAVLGLDDIVSEVADLVASHARASLDVARLSRALNWVLAYLADAYREAGNDEKRWTDAYWQHADMLVDRLPETIRTLPSDIPSFERDVVFASAGLPRPGWSEYYAAKNGPPKYASIVVKSWSSQDEIFRSLAKIARVDTQGAGNHPLFAIKWSEFPTTRTSLGHLLLAVANHGAGEHDSSRWLKGWANTSEKAFFGVRDAEAPKEYELCSLSEDGDSRVVSRLGWQGLDHVLPPGPTVLREDGQISLGKFRLRLAVDVDASGQSAPVTLDSQPASSCTPEIISWEQVNGNLLIEFELSRRAARNGGKWREKPFTLSILPVCVVPGSSFTNGLSLKLCAPHPARPTAIAVEYRGGRRKPLPAFATDGRYEIERETRTIGFSGGDQEIAHLPLHDGMTSSRLAVVGLTLNPTWTSGETLTQEDPPDPSMAAQFFALTPPPEDAVIALDEYHLNVQAPEVDRGGQVNPIFAAILGQPVVPADDDLRDELRSDPRGLLEEWYQQNYISAQPTDDMRSCLGACVLEAASRGTRSLAWNPNIGTFADTTAPIFLAFPRELAKRPEAEAFWKAFEDLDLKTCGGAQRISAWPSALDLKRMPPHRVDRYLSTYCDLLKTIGAPRAESWLAYPFSALLYNQAAGDAEGVLLSPLHPLRLAWAWSVQRVSDEVARSEVFGPVASSFLRFVDGELLPLSGPATRSSERWVSTGLAPGPQDFFVGWTLLAGTSVREKDAGMAISLMGLGLPFGTPSGLDQGGVAAALRDYLRTYPASPQLRIGLAAPRGGERYAETDEAIVAASGEVIARYGDSLPGGVRIFDASDRRGRPPSPVNVLRKILSGGMDSKDPAARPLFEWTTEGAQGPASKVDIQFIEDKVVRVSAEAITAGSETIGTAGPAFPFNRFRSWRLDELANGVSSFALGLQEDCFGELPSFPRALGQLENLKVSGTGLKLTAELRLGTAFLGDHARWTITGNRHLDPSVLSFQLRGAPGEIALWEWRPAFLSRQNQKGAIVSVASTHPYTVLARPSSALTDEVATVLQQCSMTSSHADVRDVITNLGVRGVGLSSLLTMGHTQSLGAIGFSLAFRALQTWESNTDSDEVRCIVPMDSVYPLLDVLGQGATITDDQRRADLLLMSARFPTGGPCSLRFQAVEVKMRSGQPGSFPQRGSATLADPLEQLASTHRILEHLCQNHEREGRKLSLANAALATLLEAAFSLRPADSTRQTPLETRILRAVASGEVTPSASSGTLLWFQVGATGLGGGPYEQRSPNNGEPGQVFANPAALDDAVTRGDIGKAVASIIARDRPAKDLVDALRPGGDEQGTARPSVREDVQPEIHGELESATANSDPGEQRPAEEEELTVRADEPGEIAVPEKALTPEGISILIGHTPDGAALDPVYFTPSETELNQLNIGVVGDLGDREDPVSQVAGVPANGHRSFQPWARAQGLHL